MKESPKKPKPTLDSLLKDERVITQQKKWWEFWK
jgi:hypothetical protein